MARVRGVPGLENLDVNWQEAMPEIQWKVDRAEGAPARRQLLRHRQHHQHRHQRHDRRATTRRRASSTRSSCRCRRPPARRSREMQNLVDQPRARRQRHRSPSCSARWRSPVYGWAPARSRARTGSATSPSPASRRAAPSGEIQADIEKAHGRREAARRLLLGLGHQPEAAGGGVRRHVAGGGPGHRPDLHAAGLPVRVVHPPADDPALRAARAHRGDARPVPHRALLRPDGVHRRADAGGDRGQERHPAGGLHQRAARARHGARGGPADGRARPGCARS